MGLFVFAETDPATDEFVRLKAFLAWTAIEQRNRVRALLYEICV